MKILIVDDEPRHRRGMMNVLKKIRPDYQVVSAKDGVDALEAVRLMQPDIVLSDIRMPKMDGLAFLEKLGETDARPKVIFLSAYNLFEYAQKALRHGAYDYLLKPVDMEKVEAVLERIESQMAAESRKRIELAKDRAVSAWLNGRCDAEQRQAVEAMGIGSEPGFVALTEYSPIEPDAWDRAKALLCGDLERIWSSARVTRACIVDEMKEQRLRAVTMVHNPNRPAGTAGKSGKGSRSWSHDHKLHSESDRLQYI